MEERRTVNIISFFEAKKRATPSGIAPLNQTSTLLFLVALGTITLYAESGLAIVACAAGLAGLHILHGCAPVTAIVEYLCMAILACKHCGVGIMLEVSYNCTASIFEGQIARLETLVALGAVAVCCESSFAIMAGAARLSLVHICHCVVYCTCSVLVGLCVTVITFIYSGVKLVAEASGRNTNLFYLEQNLFRIKGLVTASTVSRCSKC